jgi:hypothetical protein
MHSYPLLTTAEIFLPFFKTFNVQIDSVNSKNLEEKKISVTF